MDPAELNRLVLYTLHHFTEWVPPHLTIAYALGEISWMEENTASTPSIIMGCSGKTVLFSCGIDKLTTESKQNTTTDNRQQEKDEHCSTNCRDAVSTAPQTPSGTNRGADCEDQCT